MASMAKEGLSQRSGRALRHEQPPATPSRWWTMRRTSLLVAGGMFALVVALVRSPAARADCPSGDFAACTARCDKGDREACTSLGAIYRIGGHGVARNEPRAVELYRRACNLGSAKGCTSLREMYSEGRGVKGGERK
jgi:TPR repeat protein